MWLLASDIWLARVVGIWYLNKSKKETVDKEEEKNTIALNVNVDFNKKASEVGDEDKGKDKVEFKFEFQAEGGSED